MLYMVLPTVYKPSAIGITTDEARMISGRLEGNIRVIITYSDQAEIHHIMKKLQRMGYEVSSTQTKGTYITGALGGVKQFRVEDHKFSNEYDLYAYLNSINGGAK